MFAELIIVFNFILNLALLRFTQAVTNVTIPIWRMLISSLSSALIVVIFYGHAWVIFVSFILLIGIAFSFRVKSFFVQGGWLLVATLLAGGLLTAVQPLLMHRSSFVYIIICFCIVCSSLLIMKTSWKAKLIQMIQTQYVTPCEVQLAGETLALRAYIDTGNECIEPLSQAPVHFISFQAVREKLPVELSESLLQWSEQAPLELEMFPPKFRKIMRIVSITTIQNRKVFVPAFRIALCMNEKTYQNHYVVFTKNDARFPQNAQMIAHVIVLINS